MPAASPQTDSPTAEQIKRCGEIWDGALRCDCEALLYHSGFYRRVSEGVLQDHALCRWSQLGYQIKIDVARSMLALGKTLRTAV
jgi:hypothetical protein